MEKLKNVYKLDYFLSDCSRQFDIVLYENIGEIILEYMKKPKRNKKRNKKKKKISKRETYLRDTCNKRYDL